MSSSFAAHGAGEGDSCAPQPPLPAGPAPDHVVARAVHSRERSTHTFTAAQSQAADSTTPPAHSTASALSPASHASTPSHTALLVPAGSPSAASPRSGHALQAPFVHNDEPGNGVRLSVVMCAQCQATNPMANFFCSQCQTSLTSQRKTTLAVCAACHRQNPPGCMVCECGAPLASPRTLNRRRVQKGAEHDVPMVLCGKCGHANDLHCELCVRCRGMLPHKSPNKPERSPEEHFGVFSGYQPQSVPQSCCVVL